MKNNKIALRAFQLNKLMDKNKASFFSICILLLLVIVSACNSGTNSTLNFSSFGTIESENTMYLDNDTLTVQAQQNFSTEYKVGDRVIAYFEILDKYSNPIKVKVNELKKLPNDSIITVVNSDVDSTFVDPITGIQRIWITKDYLTVDYSYWAYSTDLHKFRLTKFLNENPVKIDPATSNVIPADTVRLHLGHDAGGDEKGIKNNIIHSFNLSSLKPLGRDSLVLVIRSSLYKTDSTNTSDTRYFYYK